MSILETMLAYRLTGMASISAQFICQMSYVALFAYTIEVGHIICGRGTNLSRRLRGLRQRACRWIPGYRVKIPGIGQWRPHPDQVQRSPSLSERRRAHTPTSILGRAPGTARPPRPQTEQSRLRTSQRNMPLW